MTPLVSDQPGQAAHTDANLVNPWGVSFGATSPFWVSNAETGTSTLYDGSGTPQALVVNIPAPGGGKGAPTGQVFNPTTDFLVGTSGKALFIFATENGTIVAWNPAGGTNGKIVADRSGSNAVYKGLALASTGGQNFLFATDFRNARIDRFDKDFRFVGSFTDSSVPAGYAPFNVVNINGDLYVTFAKQLGPDNEDDAAGPGRGFVDIFHPDGTLARRLISQGVLNSPWGLAVAPPSFGAFAGKLLVGNFGDGTIHAFDPTTGHLIGQLTNPDGSDLIIPGLWTLLFGNGGRGGSPDILYFSAGSDGEQHGLFGQIQPQ
jgi:uncharacterized protein (TIGR03118 family)